MPKYHFDLETGELGERNGAYVTNVEHKMGLKVSTTCEVTFGDREPAVGTLLGDTHDGIAQMFRVIEHARMLVGTKAISTLSTAYLNALEYAKERVQGADLTQMTDKSAPRVTITHHPDVRRSLMTLKAYAEGLRALVVFTATQQDTSTRRSSPVVPRSSRRTAPPTWPTGSTTCCCRSSRASARSGPGCCWDGVAADARWLGLPAGLPDRAVHRDAKIDTLYEGTTAIQGLDFFFRKIIRDKAQALSHLAMQIQEFAKDLGATGGTLDTERELLGKGLEDVQGILGFMVGELMKSDPRQEGSDVTNLYKVGQEHLPPADGGRRPRDRLAAAAPGGGRAEGPRGRRLGPRTATSTRARSRPRASSPATCCRRSPRSARSPRATDNALMDVPESAF